MKISFKAEDRRIGSIHSEYFHVMVDVIVVLFFLFVNFLMNCIDIFYIELVKYLKFISYKHI